MSFTEKNPSEKTVQLCRTVGTNNETNCILINIVLLQIINKINLPNYHLSSLKHEFCHLQE